MPRHGLGKWSPVTRTYLIVFSMLVVLSALVWVGMYDFQRHPQSPPPNTRTSNNTTEQAASGISPDPQSLHEHDSLQPQPVEPKATTIAPPATDSKQVDQHPSDARSSEAKEKTPDQKREKDRRSGSIACLGEICL